MFQLLFHAPYAHMDTLASAFDHEDVVSFSWKEHNAHDPWQGVAIFADKPDLQWWTNHVQQYCADAGIDAPTLSLEVVPDKDWVAENQRIFAPFQVGSFYIYGSDYAGAIPTGLHPLMIDAATAFGSGQHETTQGCLLALERLLQSGFTPHKIVDVGCGSGVLAMGAARLWGCPVVAIDNDADAVVVAQENIENNGLHNQVQTLCGDGHTLPLDPHSCDIVVANILAEPLCRMANMLHQTLAPHGVIILSGIMNDQADMVQNAYVQQGLRLQHKQELGEWSTLVLGETVLIS